MKRILYVLTLVLIALSAVYAGGSNEESGKTTLEFAIKETGSTLEAYKQIVDSFNAEHEDIKVEISDYGKDYQTLMKTKMATNDLPDLFTTHGWAVALYGDYLYPLNGRPWAEHLFPEIRSTDTDREGNLVALPMDIDITGLVCNDTVLEKSGVAERPSTLSEFIAACQKIKEAGFTPIHIAGKDSSDVAGLFSRLSLSILTMSNTHSYAEELLDGTFDWSCYDEVGNFVLSLVENGYTNVDYLTADKSGTYRGLAQDKVAFAFQSNLTIAEVRKLNPDANVSMMEIPGYTEGDSSFLISGERDAVGVWKDSEHLEEALEFIDYLAQPENVLLVAQAYSLPPSMDNAEVTDPGILAILDQIKGSVVTNHFDRMYLPDGMWNTLKVYGTSVLSGEMSVRDGSMMMQADYERLRNNA